MGERAPAPGRTPPRGVTLQKSRRPKRHAFTLTCGNGSAFLPGEPPPFGISSRAVDTPGKPREGLQGEKPQEVLARKQGEPGFTLFPQSANYLRISYNIHKWKSTPPAPCKSLATCAHRVEVCEVTGQRG